jgi:mono/diheme cytochrome c family protein
MKKFFGIVNIVIAGIIITGCSDVRRNPGRVYMPDMAYSRAIETYALLDSARFTSDTNHLGEGKIFYNSRPVIGTMAIGDMMPFELSRDKAGDSTNYSASRAVKNPLDSLDAGQMKEAERLYLVNCAICHGMKLDGNGPLYNGGNGPFAAAPRNLVTYVLPEGQMFYSMTYGKGAMGSYASQITTKQRWMVIDYIKMKQRTGASATPAGATKDSTGASGKVDSTKTK